MELNSFRGKLIESVINKCVIGVIASVLVLLFNAQTHRYQLVRDARIAVSNIHTEIVLQQRRQVIELMNQYFACVSAVSTGRIATSDLGEQVLRLDALRNQVELAVSFMAVVDQSFDTKAKPLLDSMAILNVQLNDVPVNTELQELERVVRDAYKAFLVEVRNLSRQAVTRDMLG